MNFTRKLTQWKRRTLRARSDMSTLFEQVKFGKSGSVDIQCTGREGVGLISSLSDEAIQSLNWRGALAVYFCLTANHPSISCDSEYYFMVPDLDGFDGKPILCEQTLFLALFHHIHGCLIRHSYEGVPPFHSELVKKVSYVKTIFDEDIQLPLELSDSNLETLLTHIQVKLGRWYYNSICEFKERLRSIQFAVVPIEFDTTKRIELLVKYFKNAEQVLLFITSPIDSNPPVVNTLDIIYRDKFLVPICELVLKKLDSHCIFVQTGVQPLDIDWLHELDIILNKTLQ